MEAMVWVFCHLLDEQTLYVERLTWWTVAHVRLFSWKEIKMLTYGYYTAAQAGRVPKATAQFSAYNYTLKL